MITNLYSELEECGWKGRVVPIRHLAELQEEIEGRFARGEFDKTFFEERLTFYSFTPPEDFPPPASLIVVAVPKPITRIGFTWRGKPRPLILPPTYVGYRETHQKVGDRLNSWLSPHGYRVTKARVPQKLLAARSGLAEYGRNNIGYIPGFGSFYQPTAFYSDLPCDEDPWQESHMLERCRDCRACLLKCPTGAITEERFLIRAERCLVYHNERPAEYPFPAWVDPSAHHCLMGCMYCQQYCPEDKPFLDWIEGEIEFSEEETSLLLKGVSLEQLSAPTKTRLELLGLLESLDILPRNLGVLFKEG